MTFRGKRREVVEVVSKERSGGAYHFRVRLSCGHQCRVVNAKTRADYVPTVGYCNHPECVMGKAVAA